MPTTTATPLITITRDPWNPTTQPVAHVIHPCPTCGVPGHTAAHAAQLDRDANRPCRCGYDLCGECMSTAHAGGRPVRRMTVPGVVRMP